MKKINSKTIIAIVCMAISMVWIYKGITQYGLWDTHNGPKSGFFPVIIAIVLLISSFIYFISSFKMEKTKYDKEAIYIISAMVFIVLATYVIGFLPAILVFYVFWLKVIEKLPAKTIIISTVVMSVIIYGTFSAWLSVPFPKGWIFELFV